MSSIDFVIPWVDGNDPEWRKQKRKVCSEFMDDRPQRYRDWGLLRYWFRGVEAFTPWVNRIHFITWGHLPPWLNTQHPKLHIVRHEDYIPAEYLPTFSSHVIELNMHRVDGLSRQFVYFNDDMFLLRPLKETDFFRNGLPCDSALMNPVATDDLCKPGNGGKIFSIPYNNVQYLNRDFDMRQSMKEHWRKWYSPRYGSYLIRNLLLSIWPRFVGFVDLHLAQPFLKASFEEAWARDGDILDATCRHAIRNDHDVNQWLIRYRQLAQGRFVPVKPTRDAVFQMDEQTDKLVCDCISRQKKSMICINDGEMGTNAFEKARLQLQTAFASILPTASAYEKDQGGMIL